MLFGLFILLNFSVSVAVCLQINQLLSQIKKIQILLLKIINYYITFSNNVCTLEHVARYLVPATQSLSSSVVAVVAT